MNQADGGSVRLCARVLLGPGAIFNPRPPGPFYSWAVAGVFCCKLAKLNPGQSHLQQLNFAGRIVRVLSYTHALGSQVSIFVRCERVRVHVVNSAAFGRPTVCSLVMPATLRNMRSCRTVG
jgi:hypothetical protein